MATITERLGKLPLGSFHYRLLALMGSGIAFEALDTGLIAFVLAKMIGAWNLSPAQIGYISSAGLLGMAVGAILSGTLADRVGRKKVFVATLGFYAVGTGLCGLAWNYESLLAFRFLVGAGVGGQPPVANALMSEYAPVKHRGKMLVLQNSSWAIGWLLAALISYLIIPQYGWQLAFYIGALPALVVVYVWRILPESAMYLVSRGRHMEAHVLVSKIEQELGVPVGEPPHKQETESAESQAFTFMDLWSSRYIRRTICLWVLW
ncbi:MAG: naiP 1, partial [Firmicutes bacterium]|nr:naiP 1 [Bacillota bacterium]